MGRILECKCNGDCFNCRFKDCIASYEEVDFLDRKERKIKKNNNQEKEIKKVC